MKRILFIFISVFIISVLSSAGSAVSVGSEKFDEKMQPILVEYLKIADTLASDKTDGVADSAKKIENLAVALSPSLVTGEHASHYKSIPGKISDGARRTAQGKDISSVRAAFVDLSKPMVMWASMSKPPEINVIYCSMNPGSWLQKGKKIRNPYYGSKMLTCGEIISGPDKNK
jgi:Cu(I)/Ag(I) efflux system membrane fusion protein